MEPIDENIIHYNVVKVDIIAKLIPFPHILEKIFGFLRPKDLRVIPCVSLTWYRALKLTPNANRKRIRSLKRLKKLKYNVGEENWPLDCKCAVLKKKLRTERQRATLGSIINMPTPNNDPSMNAREYVLSPNGKLFDIPCDETMYSTNKNRWKLAKAPFKKW